MRHFMLTAVLAIGYPAVSVAQQVPGRDLLQFPLGSMDRGAALGGGIGDGLGNPAAIALGVGDRFRAGVVALQTPGDQGVSAQLMALSAALPERLTVGLSAARVATSDIFRTDADPQTIGPEIPYGTMVFSATVARRQSRRVSAGVAVRYRTGEIDLEHRGALGIDGGLLAEHLPFHDASVGVATFLWRPANTDDERTTLNLAGDLRFAGTDARHEARAGYSLAITEGGERDHFVFATGRYARWEGRVGLARAAAFGSASWRPRLGIRVHYDVYLVGVAREQNGAGLDPIYQFMLSATIR